MYSVIKVFLLPIVLSVFLYNCVSNKMGEVEGIYLKKSFDLVIIRCNTCFLVFMWKTNSAFIVALERYSPSTGAVKVSMEIFVKNVFWWAVKYPSRYHFPKQKFQVFVDRGTRSVNLLPWVPNNKVHTLHTSTRQHPPHPERFESGILLRRSTT